MTGFSHWAVFVVGCLLGFVVGNMSGFGLAKVQVSARKAAKAWREIRGWAQTIGVAAVVVVGVGLVGFTRYHLFGFGG